MPSRLVIIGLDCATPQLVFERYRSSLPALSSVMDEGCYGLMRSSTPPITVPAWTSMTTGWDAGRLGIYGFRNRKSYDYADLHVSTNLDVKAERIWEALSRNKLKSIILGVPQTFPPRPLNGWLISSFLAPNIHSEFTFPPSLKNEILRILGTYIIDVRDYRTCETSFLINSIYQMTALRFRLAKYLIKTRSWNFLMLVEMGIDRLQHRFWRYCDHEHPQYSPGSIYENTILEYHKFIDNEISDLLEAVPAHTPVMVVSDHGAQALHGGVCINKWLVDNGYLRLNTMPMSPLPISMDLIDWANTVAWGEGGYYGRIFLNVAGREPRGIVNQLEYTAIRQELKQKLELMTLEDGQPLGNTVLIPEETYNKVNGIPPDLMVYFGNLKWRSIGTIGIESIFTKSNDTGQDEANHAQHGIFICKNFPGQPTGQISGVSVEDVAPSVLKYFGVNQHNCFDGKAIF